VSIYSNRYMASIRAANEYAFSKRLSRKFAFSRWAQSSFALILALLSVIWSLNSIAHHSSSRFDRNSTVTIDGVVTRVEWVNPHVYIYMDEVVEGERGAQWEIEGNPPTIMRRHGWSRSTLIPGVTISVTGSPHQDASFKSLLPDSILKDEVILYAQENNAIALAAPSNASPVASNSIAGVWATLAGQAMMGYANPSTLELSEAGNEALANFDEDEIDVNRYCRANPPPFFMFTPDIKEVIVETDRVLIRGEFDGAERTIYLDQAMPESAEPSALGYSVGRWESGALLIETRHFTERLMGNGFGLPSSTEKQLSERLSLNADNSSLNYEFTLTDPVYLAQEINSSAQWIHRSDMEFASVECSLENAERFLR